MSSYDIITYISEHVNIVHLIDYLVHVNHDIGVVGYWIFDSEYRQALVFSREYFHMSCEPSVGEEQVYQFEKLFTAVRYILSTAHCMKEW